MLLLVRSKRSHSVIAVMLSLIPAGPYLQGSTAPVSLFAFVVSWLLAWFWCLAGGGCYSASASLVSSSLLLYPQHGHKPAAVNAGEWKRVGAIFVFFLFTILWAAYEQKGLP